MKIFLDDLRDPPDDTWTMCRSVNEAIAEMKAVWLYDKNGVTDVALDHDLGDYVDDGGDAIKFVLWMAENHIWPYNRPTIHTGNPVGRDNMNALIERYGPYE